jgi:hypothetical protein
MTRPIPINESGMRPRHRFDTVISAPVLGAAQRAPPPALVSTNHLPFNGPILLIFSGLAGALAVASALGWCKELSATRLGMDGQGAFYLLIVGVYLLATDLYAAWRTQLLNNLNQAPWDARLMAYVNLVVGGSIVLAMVVAVLTMVAVVMILVWLGALVLSGAGGRHQD